MSRLKNLLIVFLTLVSFACLVAVVAPNVSEGQGNKKNSGARSYYMTATQHQGNTALTACAAGYHMASMWEIKDTSNFRYNTELGFTLPDSGSGPPTIGFGWVRTGGNASVDDFAGAANCLLWTSNEGDHFGTAIFLDSEWAAADSLRINPWRFGFTTCASNLRVWCLED